MVSAAKLVCRLRYLDDAFAFPRRDRPFNKRTLAPINNLVVGSGTELPIQTLSKIAAPDWEKSPGLRESGIPEKVRVTGEPTRAPVSESQTLNLALRLSRRSIW